MIPQSMFAECNSMFSLEMPEIVSEVADYAFYNCYCLRNVAFPPNAVFGNNIFIGTGIQTDTDLQLLFGSNTRIISELRHRFNELPIHSSVYFQLYCQGMLQELTDATMLDSTGNQQDCLGMTPLHILTCSSLHDLNLYRIIIEKYPANLITKDRWEALPLLYAFWGAAPSEIIQFLLKSYQLLYPDHVFNWTMMVETMGRCNTPEESIENLLCVKQMHFPEQLINWEYLLEMFAEPSNHYIYGAPNLERLQFLFMCGMSESVEALAFKVWRDQMISMIQTADYKWTEDNSCVLRRIRQTIVHFDDELAKLKAFTSILELAVWKMKMNEKICQGMATQSQKKVKTDESSIRQQSRITCGADVIIGHVLPFLIFPAK